MDTPHLPDSDEMLALARAAGRPELLPVDTWLALVNPGGRRLEDRAVVTLADLDGWDAGPEAPVTSAKLADGRVVTIRRVQDGARPDEIPTLVARLDGAVVGLAHDIQGDLGIDVAVELQGQGVGRVLLRALLRTHPFVSMGGLTRAGDALCRAVHGDLVASATRSTRTQPPARRPRRPRTTR